MYSGCVVQLLSSVWSMWPHGLQHSRFPGLPLSPRVCSNSNPLCQWRHPTISFSVTPFSCPQSVPALGSFPVNRLFASGGQSTGVSPSASILPMNIQGWFSLWLIDLLAVQGTLKSFLQHHNSIASIPQCSAFFMVQLSHPYMTTGKIIALTVWILVSKVMRLLFIVLSRLVIAFLPRSKCLLLSWLQSPSITPPKEDASSVCI